jgi:hypothetical protein
MDNLLFQQLLQTRISTNISRQLYTIREKNKVEAQQDIYCIDMNVKTNKQKNGNDFEFQFQLQQPPA